MLHDSGKDNHQEYRIAMIVADPWNEEKFDSMPLILTFPHAVSWFIAMLASLFGVVIHFLWELVVEKFKPQEDEDAAFPPQLKAGAVIALVMFLIFVFALMWL